MMKKCTLVIVLALLLSSNFQVNASSEIQPVEKSGASASIISYISPPYLSQELDAKDTIQLVKNEGSYQADRSTETSSFLFGDPAGCSAAAPIDQTSAQMLEKVRQDLGSSIVLSERRVTSIWNGPLNTMLDVSNDPYAYEFVFNSFIHPLTYLGDQVATTFLVNGFAVWFRWYGGSFRLMAVALVPGVLESPWAEYVTAYWQPDAQPQDNNIYPVIKKLPCHWMIEEGYASLDYAEYLYLLNWQIPDFHSAGSQYLAADCQEANRISQEVIGYWSAFSMCGPLAWRLLKDTNAFPYRIGSWYASDYAFVGVNPRTTGQPWGSFDPDTYDLFRTTSPMPGYDFANRGNLYPGDLLYSYGAPYFVPDDPHFDHIFMVTGLGPNNERFSISNMAQRSPYRDCSIQEIVLYTPGDRENGVINHEWNNFGFGQTGTTGFDVFRWKWITYHINGMSTSYAVRWGDTLETIAYDWKVNPLELRQVNGYDESIQLTPGQVITLPTPDPFSTQDSLLESLAAAGVEIAFTESN